MAQAAVARDGLSADKPETWIEQGFEALFALHFTYYYLISEGCSVYQFLIHVRDFGLNPVLRRTQPLNTSGRPFDPGYAPEPAPRPVAPLAADEPSGTRIPVEIRARRAS